MLYLFQKGFHYSQDGPGNRLIYHLQGCNLRCPWCSNPEGLSLTGGTGYPISELIDEVLRSRPMFFDGGGLTLTGGEVMMQKEGALRLLSEVHAAGVNTCIETNGVSSHLSALLPHIDHLIMDIKHYDPIRHRDVTGMENGATCKNLSLALDSGMDVLVRIPLIGGFNASEEDAHAFASLLLSLGMKERGALELLTYHEYGKKKYENLGLPYRMDESARVSPEMLTKFTDVIRASGIKLIKT